MSLLEQSANISFVQSAIQSFYFIKTLRARIGEIVIAYKGDVVVGYREWNGPYTDIPVMGVDSNDRTSEYCISGDIPTFKLLQLSALIRYQSVIA